MKEEKKEEREEGKLIKGKKEMTRDRDKLRPEKK